MRLMSGIVSFLARERRKKIERLLARADQEQALVFARLMKLFAESDFAHTHGLSKETTYEAFSLQTSVSSYEEFFPHIERMLKGVPGVVTEGVVSRFAKSSGTTNAKSKYIPITETNLTDNHYQAGRDMVVWAVDEYKNTRFLNGKTLGTTGNFCPDEKYPQAHIGDVSAHLFHSLPWYASRTRAAESDIFLKDNWKEKVVHLAEKTKTEDVRTLLGVPTWLLIIFDEVLSQTGKKTITEVWPNISMFFHGAMNFGPYKKVCEEKIGRKIDYMNIYNASEGFIGFQYKKEKSDEFVLLTSHDIFYECILLSDHRAGKTEAIPLSSIELGREYALVITTSGGLIRYSLGDTVVFTNKNPYLFRLTGRTKQSINTFGEEICVENIEQALASALRETHAKVAHFTVAPYINNGTGYHEWLIEFIQEPENIEAFIGMIDEQLKRLNSDYEAKRANDFVLRSPQITIIKPGTFMRWLEKRGKLGGQHKVPLLSEDRTFLEEIKELNVL